MVATAKLIDRSFWITVLANLFLLWLLANQPTGGTDSYAVGIGAFLYYALAVVIAGAALLFWSVKWRPLRIVLTAMSVIAMLFLLVNVIDPWWW